MDSNSDVIWSRRFISIVFSNGFFFAGFHMLLPAVPLLAIQMGGSKTEVGFVAGIFVLSSVITRFFTDQAVRRLGARNSLILGIAVSFVSALSYIAASDVGSLLWIRVLNGAGFGIGTTFYVAVVTEYIPASRRGEGLGYFGLATTIAMAVAPATGLWIVGRWGFNAMFALSAVFETVALLWLAGCSFRDLNEEIPPKPVATPTRSFDPRRLAGYLVEKGTGLPAILTVLFGTAYGSVLNFVAVYAQERGIGGAGIYFLVATTFIFVARLATAKVYDRKGEAWMLIPGGLTLSAGLLLLALSPSTPVFFLSAVLYGWGVGMTFPALQTGTLVRVRRERRSGASATFSNALDVGLGGGSVMLGTLAQHTGMVTAFLAASAAGLLMLAVFVLAQTATRDEPVALPAPEE